MISRLFVLLPVVLTLFAFVSPSHAQLEVDVTQGYADPIDVAVPAFVTASKVETAVGSASEIGEKIAFVINSNLKRSGLFAPINSNSFVRTLRPGEVRPEMGVWRAIKAEALVAGGLDIASDGSINVEFRLWDVYSEAQLTGLRYTLPARNWRRVAHLISDAVYKRLTGEAGYFDSRIVYIAESGVKTQRVKRLAIMDQDGANHRFLTDGNDLVLTPRFSPSQQEITYMAYYNDRPRVYLYNLESGKHEVLGDFPNMTFAPRFSPDGNKIVMSLTRGGNSDIFSMDLRTRQVRQLTNDPAIDTSGSFAPSGDRLVFNSDRGGTQQLYVMDANGKNVRRISFGNGRYGTPVWSPRGDLIAFTKIDPKSRQFRIGVMRPDGKGERMLTASYQDEGPTWSPNGRVIIFFRTEPYTRSGKGGEVSLWSVDLTGRNERQIPTPTQASDPAWSPLIQ